MGTGHVFAHITNKRILGNEDFATRFLGYLKTLTYESAQVRFNVDGAFDTLLGLSGAAGAVTITGTSKATDGLGHTLDVTQIYPGATFTFENAVGIQYDVGLRYCEVYETIGINPREGRPEYLNVKEMLGELGDPTSVTDNGNGTITFNVNSVTEAGVSNAGRKVKVYKKVPATGATTDALAFQECTVAFGSGNNTITTTNTLGQTVVSTTASDYVVVLLGATIKRNTNLEASSNHFFIGKVTGVGGGGVPAVFDTSLQRLLKSFNAASQIAFTPYSWLTGITAQQALQDVVDVLGSNAVASGASRIGVRADDYSTDIWTNNGDECWGLGNYSGGTGSLTNTTMLHTLLTKIDTVLHRQSVFLTARPATSAPAKGSGPQAMKDTDTIAATIGDEERLTALRAGAYTWTAEVETGGLWMGDKAGRNAAASATTNRALLRFGSTFTSWSPGALSRLALAGTTSGICHFGGLGATARHVGTILQDVIAESGRVRLGHQSSAGSMQPFEWRNGWIYSAANATSGLSASLVIGATGGTGMTHALFENLVIEGLDAAQTSPVASAGALRVESLGQHLTSTTGVKPKPIVFRNCVFVMKRPDKELFIYASAVPITFDNCTFVGMNGATAGLVAASGITNGHLVFNHCWFFDPEGASTVFLNACPAVFRDCFIHFGYDSAATNASPRILYAHGKREGVTIDNLTVVIGNGGTRASGSSNPLIEFAATGGESVVKVRNLKVHFPSAASIHASPLIKAHATSRDEVDIDGAYIDFNSCTMPTAPAVNVFDFDGADDSMKSVKFRNFLLLRWAKPSSDNANINLFNATQAFIEQGKVELPTSGTGKIGSLFNLFQSKVKDIELFATASPVTISCANPVFNFGSGGRTSVEEVKLYDAIVLTSKFISVHISSAGCQFSGFKGNGASVTVTGVGFAEIGGSDFMFKDCYFATVGDPGVPLINFSNPLGTYAMMCGNNISWNGTTQPAVLLDHNNSLVAMNIIRRSSGATGHISDTSTGSTVTPNILT